MKRGKENTGLSEIEMGTEINFRPWRHADRESLVKNADNIKIWNNVRDYFPHPYTLDDADSWIELALSRNPMADFAITVDDLAVGGIGYIPQSDIQRFSAEIGYWLGEKYWGRGIVPAVLERFCEHIFTTTGIITLFAPVFDFNKASQRVLEKSGFKCSGIMHRSAVKNGKVIDMFYYERHRV